jgi:hypothetical protein
LKYSIVLKIMRLLPILILSLGINTASGKTDSIPGLPQYASASSNPQMQQAFTALNARYLTRTERDIIHVLNLMRIDPPGFAEKVVKSYPDQAGDPEMRRSSYYKSLLRDLAAASPLPPLKPDEALFNYARCHATRSGLTGYVGHKRSNPCEENTKYGGECCQYGMEDALGVVMELLIDQNIPDLGHRKILMTGFTHIGVAMRQHKTYRVNTVLDLGSSPKNLPE